MGASVLQAVEGKTGTFPQGASLYGAQSVRNKSVAVKRFAQCSFGFLRRRSVVVVSPCELANRDLAGGSLLRGAVPAEEVFMAAVSAEDNGSSHAAATLRGTCCKSDRVSVVVKSFIVKMSPWKKRPAFWRIVEQINQGGNLGGSAGGDLVGVP